MPEAILEAVAVGDQDVLGNGFPYPGQQFRGRETRRRLEQPVIGGTADHRRAPQDVLGDLRQSVDAREHDLAECRWDRGIAFVVDREELLGEEDVAVGTPEGPLDELGRRLGAHDRGDELAYLVAIEARELDPVDRTRTVELGEQRTQRMAAVEIIGAVGPDEHDRGRTQAAREVHEQLACGAVGPMDVLEHQQCRHALGQSFEDAEELLEQRARDDAFARGRVQLGQQRRELVAPGPDDGVERRLVECPVQGAQHLHDRAEGERAVDEVEALTYEHQCRFRETLDQLVDEPRLSDPRLARDEHGRRALVDDGRLPARLEPRQLGAATDEPGAGDAGGHGLQSGPAAILVEAGFGRHHRVTWSRAPHRGWSGAGGRRGVPATCGTSGTGRGAGAWPGPWPVPKPGARRPPAATGRAGRRSVVS